MSGDALELAVVVSWILVCAFSPAMATKPFNLRPMHMIKRNDKVIVEDIDLKTHGQKGVVIRLKDDRTMHKSSKAIVKLESGRVITICHNSLWKEDW